MGNRQVLAMVGVIVAVVLVASGCAAESSAGPASPTPTAKASVTPSPTPTATPAPVPTTPAVEVPLAQTIDAGAVADGTSATVSGTGPSNVTYQRQGDFAVVVGLDCSACAGTAVVTAPGRMSPFGEAAAPITGSFLMDIFKDNPVDQMLIVKAEGPWQVTLQSWNDLPTVSGAQSGAGPAVLFFSDDVSRVTVDYTPAGADDSFSGRVYTTSDDTQLFGDSVAFSEVFDADLPGVIAIQTNGTWSVTPTP